MADGAQQNATSDGLSAKQQRAAVLVSEDRLTDEEIAAEIGVNRVTLHRWKTTPEFQAAVKAADAAILTKALRLPIARKYHRLKTLDTLHAKALAVIDARARYMDGDAPGAETGLLVRQVKAVGTGRDAQVVEEYVFDAALAREIRAQEEQAAKETGDWTENLNVTGTTAVRLIGIDPDDV